MRIAAPDTPTDGASSYSFVTSNSTVRGSYTNSRISTWTINAPDLSGTRVVVSNSWFFPAGWAGASTDVRIIPELRLHSLDGTGASNEFAVATYNGVTNAVPAGEQSVSLVVKPGTGQMADGRKYKISMTFPIWDTAYDAATSAYVSNRVEPYIYGRVACGVCGVWAANPGNPVVADSTYYAVVTFDIGIATPPPGAKGFTIISK